MAKKEYKTPESQRAVVRAYLQRRRENGQCLWCGVKTSPHKYCPVCRQRIKENSRARRAKLLREGICTCCGKTPPVPGKVRCSACVAWGVIKQREAYRRRAKTGRCTRCSQPIWRADSRHCAKHREVNRARSKARRDGKRRDGLCLFTSCRESAGPTSSVYCEKHRQERQAYDREWRRKKAERAAAVQA